MKDPEIPVRRGLVVLRNYPVWMSATRIVCGIAWNERSMHIIRILIRILVNGTSVPSEPISTLDGLLGVSEH